MADLTSRAAVERAVVEFDELGRDGFLERYGFGRARDYFLLVGAQKYDSKAIVAAAHGIERPDLGPLRAADFSGGEATVGKKLEDLGFEVSKPAGRNPSWAFDELILALDLYVTHGRALDDSDPEVIELSEVLNSLPIHTVRPDADRFRNPNGVALKLANFAALDPDYPGKGMQAGGRRDAEVWERYHDDPEELHRLADEIRSGAASFPLVPEEDEDEVEEGRLLYRRHRTRERDRRVAKSKKASVLKATGRLECEVCGFDFAAAYGDLGEGFIECHHTVPLAESGPTTTKLADLALLCSNCHRMVHRRQPFATVQDLRAIRDSGGE